MDIDREKEGKCLTVTVPCYNSESYLERCVESLFKRARRAGNYSGG